MHLVALLAVRCRMKSNPVRNFWRFLLVELTSNKNLTNSKYVNDYFLLYWNTSSCSCQSENVNFIRYFQLWSPTIVSRKGVVFSTVLLLQLGMLSTDYFDLTLAFGSRFTWFLLVLGYLGGGFAFTTIGSAFFVLGYLLSRALEQRNMICFLKTSMYRLRSLFFLFCVLSPSRGN